MTNDQAQTLSVGHSHVFLSAGHERAERSTWFVIWLCGAMSGDHHHGHGHAHGRDEDDHAGEDEHVIGTPAGELAA